MNITLHAIHIKENNQIKRQSGLNYVKIQEHNKNIQNKNLFININNKN